MRLHRLALVAAWMAVSLVAVVGFANFTAEREAATRPVASTVTLPSDIGADAGAVAAMAFVYDGGAVRSKTVAPETSEPTTDTTDVLESSTTFVRSAILGESEARAHASEAFEVEDVPRALRSAWCASGFNPGAVNTVTGVAGLFQIPTEQWNEYAAQAGVSGADILDPAANTKVAGWIVYNVDGGWSNLTCPG